MLTIAYSIFLLNFLFGVLVKQRVIDSSRFRFVHHALYFLTVAGIIAAAALSIAPAPVRALLLAAMTVLLLLMPLFKGRSRGHWMYATLCSALYSAIVIAS